MLLNMESKVRTIAREVINGLQNANDTQNTVKWLSAASWLIKDERFDAQSNHGVEFPPVLQHHHEHDDDISAVVLRNMFRARHYGLLCSTLLDMLSVDWIQKLPGKLCAEYFDTLFLDGPASDALLCLDHAVQINKHGFKLQKTVSLLDCFVQGGRLTQLMWDQCQVLGSLQDQGQHAVLAGHGGLWDELILTLSSLPTKLANRLGRENSETFLLHNYIPQLGRCIFECFQKAHDRLSNGQDCSMEFISRLVGKLCFTGSADLLLDTLVPLLSSCVNKDYIWCRLSQRVITGVPPLSMESVIVPLLSKILWYKWVDKFLGDCVVSNQKVRFLLCSKLLFHRYFSQVLLLQNLIGYLASSYSRRHLFLEVLRQLLNVWGDASSLRHTSSEQHLFLCRALIICVSHISTQELEHNKDELIQLLVPGVQVHLGSTDVAVRSRGMLVATLLTRAVDPTGPQIDFEIPKSQEIEDMEKLLQVPVDPGLEEVERVVEKLQINESNRLMTEAPNSALSNAQLGLDSDDDLEPYDMSCDKPLSKVKAPKYIRDCMEGLLSTEQVDKFEASLLAAEGLIRSEPDGIQEIAAEFAKILLHTTESCGLSEFVTLRMKCLVALAVQCPASVAQYLTSQFYERNYNIRQRLDILEVLAAAAQELSQPEKQRKADAVGNRKQTTELTPGLTQPETWREVVQKRIDSKTRKFGRGRTQPEPVATANRFGKVAGEFFFPLMRFVDRGERFLDLMGDDSLVLHRLVYTLAIILHCAVNTTAARQMGKILLELTWSLRLHRDVSVRQAVLVATSVILLTLPAHFLLTDLQVDLMETKAWLEASVEKEVNEECRRLAAQGLTLLESLINKELHEAAARTS